jgi:anti-sigma regulatory factor (Ser/Thr protein kinase)
MQALEPASLDLRLKARPELAAGLRRSLRSWLGEHGATTDEVFAVVMATSEAFVNAVEHPQDPTVDLIDIGGMVVDGVLTLTVRDYGSWQQRRRRPGGNGFLLMRELMDAVEVDHRLDGTEVTLRRRLTRISGVRPAAARGGLTSASRRRSKPTRLRPLRHGARARRRGR